MRSATKVFIVLVVVLGLLIALGLYSLAKARNFYTVFFVLPTLVSFVAAGTIWDWMFHSQFGPINMVLMASGGVMYRAKSSRKVSQCS